jgi:ATP-binding cassette, subfamily F, member 3
MSVLSFHEVSMQFAGQVVLDQVSFTLTAGMKAGLVGENGGGKSTLLRLAVGELRPDRGQVVLAGTARCAYAPQHPEDSAAATALDYAMELRGAAGLLRAKLTQLEAADGARAQEEYADAVARYTALGGYECERDTLQALAALGLGREMALRPLASLSGGERARAALVRALAAGAELLLLDEPDHHLDIAGRQWLAQALRRYHGVVLLVSHDRELLDAVVDTVLELEDAALRCEHGTLVQYLERKRARLLRQAVDYAQQQRHVEQLRADIARTEQSARRFQNLSANDHWRQVGKKVAKTAVVRKHLLERELADAQRVERPAERERIHLELDTQRGGRLLLQFDEVSLTLGHRALLSGVNLRLERGERIAITGANGAGKTTLLELALGRLTPDAGSVWRSSAPCFYCDQERAGLDPDLSALAMLQTACSMSCNMAHMLLARQGMRDRNAHKLVSALSGGERTRLLLAMLEHCPAGLLVLDEPTNHLDLPSLEVLEAALAAYAGGVLLVSHDRRLVRNTATQRYELRGGRLALG